MKSLLSIILIFSMSLNLTVSLVKQLRCCDLTELSELESDDSDGKEKSEKEQEKEKETYTFSGCQLLQSKVNLFKKLTKQMFAESENLISESFVLLPELPPEC